MCLTKINQNKIKNKLENKKENMNNFKRNRHFLEKLTKNI